MAKFCNKCGSPLIEGQPHVCPAGQGLGFDPGFTPNGFGGQSGDSTGFTPNGFAGQGGDSTGFTPNGFAGQGGDSTGFTPNGFGGQAGGYTPPTDRVFTPPTLTLRPDRSALSQWWAALMNRIGVGDPESNSDGVYERGMQIVPDNLAMNEGEVPIRQYDVAVLRSRMKLERAEGRLQVTNKRLLFRATGRSVRGKTTLQHEFAVDDLKGFEIRKDYRLSFLDLLAALLCTALVGGAFGALLTALVRESATLASLLGLILGCAGIVPFFMLYRRFFLKVLCSAAGTMSVMTAFTLAKALARYQDSFGWSLISGLCAIVMVASAIILLLGIFLFSFKPNLVFDFKTMGGGAPIQIRARSVLGMNRADYTGFNEVLPAADTERALREVGALINDIQKMGDRAIEQWKV